MAGISSSLTALIGLPQLSASSAAKPVGFRLDPVGDLQEIAGAFRRRGPRPGLEGLLGGSDRALDLDRGGFGQVQDGLAGARVEDLSSVSVPASKRLPISIWVSMSFLP
jgi:hypothetical protein